MENDLQEKQQKNFKVEFVLIFVLGLLLGVTFKTEALKRVTIGFNDYQLQSSVGAYNISEAEERLKKEAEEKAAAQNNPENAGESNVPTGASCN